jgi:Leucine-rich repeat (LRR) protein
MVIYCKINRIKFAFSNIDGLLEFNRYNEITCLDCSYNELTKLPELPSTLRELHCLRNELTKLPELPTTLRKINCSSIIITNIKLLQQ